MTDVLSALVVTIGAGAPAYLCCVRPTRRYESTASAPRPAVPPATEGVAMSTGKQGPRAETRAVCSSTAQTSSGG